MAKPLGVAISPNDPPQVGTVGSGAIRTFFDIDHFTRRCTKDLSKSHEWKHGLSLRVG